MATKKNHFARNNKGKLKNEYNQKEGSQIKRKRGAIVREFDKKEQNLRILHMPDP